MGKGERKRKMTMGKWEIFGLKIKVLEIHNVVNASSSFISTP
jgi:hypothetical protein